MKPELAWPRLRDFWTAQGLALETEESDIGVMETEWAARREALPAGDSRERSSESPMRSTGSRLRDRYRTRIERGTEPDTTDIYISHRGAEQVFVGAETHDARKEEGLGETLWQPRPSDPGLEAEMLSRLMIFLGLDEERAGRHRCRRRRSRARRASRASRRRHAALLLDQGFSQAWRRTGLALDRAGFTVQDRDRSRGLYFVRYAGGGEGTSQEDRGGSLD